MKKVVLTLMVVGSFATPAHAEDEVLQVLPNLEVRIPLLPVTPEARAHIDNFRQESPDRGSSQPSVRRNSLSRFFPPARNQGSRGTCSVFATVGLLEYFDGRDLSEQCLAKMSSDADAGWPDVRLSYVRDHGIYLERDCPYDPTARDAIPDLRSKELVRMPDAFTSVEADDLADPIDYIRERIDFASPVVATIWVVGRSGWVWNNGEGGFIYMPPEDVVHQEFEDGTAGGHAVVITGYDDAWQLLQFRNSWSERWGTNGYGYMSYDYFLRFRYSTLVSY